MKLVQADLIKLFDPATEAACLANTFTSTRRYILLQNQKSLSDALVQRASMAEAINSGDWKTQHYRADVSALDQKIESVSAKIDLFAGEIETYLGITGIKKPLTLTALAAEPVNDLAKLPPHGRGPVYRTK